MTHLKFPTGTRCSHGSVSRFPKNWIFPRGTGRRSAHRTNSSWGELVATAAQKNVFVL